MSLRHSIDSKSDRSRSPAPEEDAGAVGERDNSRVAAHIKAARTKRGHTLDRLAAETGLDKGYLSRVERGHKSPSIATVLKISRALDVSVAQLLGEVLDDDAIQVTRADERVGLTVSKRQSKSDFEGLTRVIGRHGLEAFIMYPSGEFSADGKVDHHGEELLFVLEGRSEVRFADRTITLDTGDCVQFAGHLEHEVRRVSAKASALIAVSRE